MNWFFIALGAPVLWACVNIADQYLISKYSSNERERSAGGLVIFSSLIGIFIALVLSVFASGIFAITLAHKLMLLLAGGMTVVWIILYLYTLEIEDVSAVVPWFLTIPIFGYILGYIFLGETLNHHQIYGSIIVLGGALLLSINFNAEKKKFKHLPMIYMATASLIVAAAGIIFKYVTSSSNFLASSFWEYLGLGIGGLIIYIFVPKHRDDFLYMNKKGGKTIILINIVSELSSIFGNMLTNFALLLAPVALVYLVGSFQPAIVLALTIIGTRLFPHIVKENISLKVLVPKMIAICIMILGSVVTLV